MNVRWCLLGLWWSFSAVAADTGAVRLEISGLDSQRGQVLVVLYNTEQGFPSQPEAAYRAAIVAPVSPMTTHVFNGLPPGTYAAFAVHDEDGDGEVATKWPIPIPKEPVGASRDAKGKFGPPRFEDAAFQVGAGEVVQRFTLVRL